MASPILYSRSSFGWFTLFLINSIFISCTPKATQTPVGKSGGNGNGATHTTSSQQQNDNSDSDSDPDSDSEPNVDPNPTLSDIEEPQNYVATVQIAPLSFVNTGAPVQSCASIPMLPDGLDLNAEEGTCQISGAAENAAAETEYTITGFSANGEDSAKIKITVVAATPPILANAANQELMAYTLAPTVSFTNTGAPAVQCESNPPLPSGLELNVADNTCEISGTPTISRENLNYTITAFAADGSQSTANIAIKVSTTCDALYFTQRGTTILSSDKITIDLPSPVKEGESFVMLSVRSLQSRPYSVFVSAKLSTVVDGYYTQLQFSRGDTTGNTIISWQVVTSPSFRVQLVTASISNTSASRTFSPVDLSKSFVLVSVSSDTLYGNRSFTRARFTSDSQVTVTRSTTSSSALSVIMYVVEWEGASVQHGQFTLSGVTSTQTISEITPEQSFLIYSYDAEADNDANRTMTQGEIISSTEVKFTRRNELTGITNIVNYSVVSHPEIKTQSGSIQLNATEASRTVNLTTPVELSNSFFPTPLMGNSDNNQSGAGSLTNAYTTYEFYDSETVIIQRASTSGILRSNWSVVSSACPVD